MSKAKQTADYAISYTLDRRMTYDGEGRELGCLTLAEASKLGPAQYEPDSDTITVETE